MSRDVLIDVWDEERGIAFDRGCRKGREESAQEIARLTKENAALKERAEAAVAQVKALSAEIRIRMEETNALCGDSRVILINTRTKARLAVAQKGGK